MVSCRSCCGIRKSIFEVLLPSEHPGVIEQGVALLSVTNGRRENARQRDHYHGLGHCLRITPKACHSKRPDPPPLIRRAGAFHNAPHGHHRRRIVSIIVIALAIPKTAAKNRSSRPNARPKPRPASRESAISSCIGLAPYPHCFQFEVGAAQSAPSHPIGGTAARDLPQRSPVCTENSDSDVLVMQSTEESM